MADPAEEASKTIKTISQQLLEKLLIDGEVNISQADDGTVKLDIETTDTGLLIGRHGETLNSFQHILSLMVYKQLGQWVRIIVDVGQYRKKREETVKQMALRAASEVTLTKRPTVLPAMVPFERRIVHITLADHPKVITESEGEGKERRVVVKPREDKQDKD